MVFVFLLTLLLAQCSHTFLTSLFLLWWRTQLLQQLLQFFSYMIVLAPRHDPDITDYLCFAKHVLQYINHIIYSSDHESSHSQIKAVYRSELVSNTPKMRLIWGNWPPFSVAASNWWSPIALWHSDILTYARALRSEPSTFLRAVYLYESFQGILAERLIELVRVGRCVFPLLFLL